MVAAASVDLDESHHFHFLCENKNFTPLFLLKHQTAQTQFPVEQLMPLIEVGLNVLLPPG